MGQLYKLIYSSLREPKCTDAEIEKILVSCKKNNPEKNITGILMHSDNSFIQYLEGAPKEILGLYDLIKLDGRHRNVVMLSYTPIRERTFPSWHMGYKNVGKLEFQTDISADDKKLFESMIAGNELEGDLSVSVLKKFFEKAK